MMIETKWNRWPCEWPKYRMNVEIMFRDGAKDFGIFDAGDFYCENSGQSGTVWANDQIVAWREVIPEALTK